MRIRREIRGQSGGLRNRGGLYRRSMGGMRFCPRQSLSQLGCLSPFRVRK